MELLQSHCVNTYRNPAGADAQAGSWALLAVGVADVAVPPLAGSLRESQAVISIMEIKMEIKSKLATSKGSRRGAALVARMATTRTTPTTTATPTGRRTGSGCGARGPGRDGPTQLPFKGIECLAGWPSLAAHLSSRPVGDVHAPLGLPPCCFDMGAEL